jgi:hypothetical protein
MSTTSVIVEILVIGVLASIWILLFALKITDKGFSDFLSYILIYKDLSVLFLFLLTGLLYQIGWIVRWIADRIIGPTIRRKIRKIVFGKKDFKNYELIKTIIYSKASPELLREIVVDHSVIRLSGSAIINFFLIGIGCCLFWKQLAYLGIISFAITLLVLWQLFDRYKYYYGRMYYAIHILKNDLGLTGDFGPPDKQPDFPYSGT